jgi:hypothetical protein
MPDAMLAGLPRLVRVAEEMRWRGGAGVAIALAVAAYWLTQWLLDADVRGLETLVSLLAVSVLTAGVAGLASAGRMRDALRETRPPPRLAVYETQADGRERHARFTGIVLLGAVVLLVFDRVTGGGGVMAGLLAGLFGTAGVVDRWEARRWLAAERARDSRLYLLIRPNAMVAKFGRSEVYEAPRRDPDREPDPIAFGL